MQVSKYRPFVFYKFTNMYHKAYHLPVIDLMNQGYFSIKDGLCHAMANQWITQQIDGVL